MIQTAPSDHGKASRYTRGTTFIPGDHRESHTAKMLEITAKKRLQQSSSGSCWTGTSVIYCHQIWKIIWFSGGKGFERPTIIKSSQEFSDSPKHNNKKKEQPPIPSEKMGCLRLGSKWIGLVGPDAGGTPFGMTNSSCFTKEFHLVVSFHL